MILVIDASIIFRACIVDSALRGIQKKYINSIVVAMNDEPVAMPLERYILMQIEQHTIHKFLHLLHCPSIKLKTTSKTNLVCEIDKVESS